ncbi:MAG: YidC/Oxa1 family membrane protein insertase [Bacillota bacterium]
MFDLLSTVALSTSLPSVRMPGNILGPIAELMSIIYNTIFNLLHNTSMTGVLGFAIIIFTLIIKTLLFPLTIKQQKSTYKMQALKPEMDAIRDKYANKKDKISQQKMAMEMQDFQKTNGVNMLGGCLPLLLQMPILYALFYVFQNAYVYVDVIGQIYVDIANAIIAIPSETRMDVFSPFAADFVDAYKSSDIIKAQPYLDLSQTNDLVMLINYIKYDEWNTILAQLGTYGADLQVLLDEKNAIEMFMMIPLVSNAGLSFPGIMIPLLAGATTFLQSKITMSQTQTDPDNPAASVTKTMTYMMPFMMGFFCITMPAGLGLYWTVGNIFGVVQQLVLKNYFQKKFAEVK